MPTCFIEKGRTSAPSVCDYGYVTPSHLGVVTCVLGAETTTTGFINRCHYRSFLRQICRKLRRIKIISTCLWNPTRRLRTNKQCIEHDILSGKVSKLTENMESWSWYTELLIPESTILQPVGASRTRGHDQISCAILQRRCLQFCFLPIRNSTVELSVYWDSQCLVPRIIQDSDYGLVP